MEICLFEYEIFGIFLHVVLVFHKFYFIFFLEYIFIRLNFSKWRKWNLNRDLLFSSNILFPNRCSLNIFTLFCIIKFCMNNNICIIWKFSFFFHFFHSIFFIQDVNIFVAQIYYVFIHLRFILQTLLSFLIFHFIESNYKFVTSNVL